MLDLDAPSLSPGSGKSHSISPEADAKARARAVELGAKWKCSRVNAWVNAGDCVARYTAASTAQPSFHCPCMECSSIIAHLRKSGIEPKKINIQEPEKMAAPAKKLEVVQPHTANPFAGWEQFDRGDRRRIGRESFVTLTKSHTLTFSSLAGEQLDLMRYASVDVYANNDKLGLHFRVDNDGQLRLTRHKTANKSWNLYISARGVCKEYGLDYLTGKRMQLKEVSPGFVEIDLSKGVVE